MLHQACERYKKLLRDCPHHGQIEVLSYTFVEILDEASKMYIDSTCENMCMEKLYGKIQVLLSKFSTNDQNWQREREPSREIGPETNGMIEIDALTALRADVAKIANQVGKPSLA